MFQNKEDTFLFSNKYDLFTNFTYSTLNIYMDLSIKY